MEVRISDRVPGQRAPPVLAQEHASRSWDPQPCHADRYTAERKHAHCLQSGRPYLLNVNGGIELVGGAAEEAGTLLEVA